jgi:hypothetical protein
MLRVLNFFLRKPASNVLIDLLTEEKKIIQNKVIKKTTLL